MEEFDDDDRVGALNRPGLYLTHDQFDAVLDWAGRPRLPTVSQKAANRPWGKSALVLFNDNNPSDKQAAVDLLQVDEETPAQFCLTLVPPRSWNPANGAGGIVPSDLQSLQGPFMRNSDITIGNALDIELVNAVAQIEWGVAGASATAEADFSNGLCVNLFASFVRVKGILVANPAANHPIVYQLAAFISHGSSTRARAQRTFEILVAGAANAVSTVRPVPAFAKSVSMSGTTGKNAAAPPDLYTGTLRFFRSVGGEADASFVCDYFFAGNSPGPFPVPCGATYFQVQNQIAGSTHQVVFDLSL